MKFDLLDAVSSNVLPAVFESDFGGKPPEPLKILFG
jgi:hypothetical protein